jgi:hypothetical protein
MSVRAKFKVTSVEANTEGGHGTVKLSPVIGGSAENDEFYKWTPSGSIELSTINESAVAQFAEGKEFFVDFTPAE